VSIYITVTVGTAPSAQFYLNPTSTTSKACAM
jgi:hypothetical protein